MTIGTVTPHLRKRVRISPLPRHIPVPCQQEYNVVLWLHRSSSCAKGGCESRAAGGLGCVSSKFAFTAGSAKGKVDPLCIFPRQLAQSSSVEASGKTLQEEGTLPAGSRLSSRQVPAVGVVFPASQLPRPRRCSHVSCLWCGWLLQRQLLGTWQPALGLWQGTSANTTAHEQLSLVL